MAIRINPKTCDFSDTDKIFIDTNIWLYLFYPGNGGDFGYSDIYENLIDSGAKLFISEQVLSEYVNRILQADFEKYKEAQRQLGNVTEISYKKDYRPTLHFKQSYLLAMRSINEDLLSVANVISIDHKDLESWCSEYEMLDFNDNVYMKLSEKQGFGILTHDKDFCSIKAPIKIYRLS